MSFRSRPSRFGVSSFGDTTSLFVHEPSPSERLSAMVFSFSKRSTIHGLNHIAQARSARRRIFWMIICSAASCGFFINLYHIGIKYVQVPVLTNVKHDHASFMFPDITVCNINPIYFPPRGSSQFKELVDRIEEYNAKIRYYQQKIEAVPEEKRSWKLKNLYKLTNNIQIADYLYMKRNISLYSIPHDTFVQYCKYMGRSVVCATEWITHRRWPYGACYQLNITSLGRHAISTDNKKAYSSGFRPDLFLLLYKGVEYPEEYRYLDSHGAITMPSGVLLMLHEPETYPQIGESFLLDKYAQVDLHMTRKQHLRKLNLCESHRDTYDYIDIETGVRRFYKETRTDCVENITQSAFKSECGCLAHQYPLKYDDAKYPFCADFEWFVANFTNMKCLLTQSEKVEAAKPLQTCYKDLCEHTSYSTVISQANYPAVVERKTHFGWLRLLAQMERAELKKYGVTDLASKALLLNESNRDTLNISTALKRGLVSLLNIEFVERNFMYLRIVPSSLFSDEMLEDEEYPLSRFLTDVGGCVGLWVGASLITVFEFCDLVLDFLGLGSIFRKRRQSRQNGHATPSGNLETNSVSRVAGMLQLHEEAANLIGDGTAMLLYSTTEYDDELRNNNSNSSSLPCRRFSKEPAVLQKPPEQQQQQQQHQNAQQVQPQLQAQQQPQQQLPKQQKPQQTHQNQQHHQSSLTCNSLSDCGSSRRSEGRTVQIGMVSTV